MTSSVRTYSRSDVEDIQITHHSTYNLDSLLAARENNTLAALPQDFAEISIYYGSSGINHALDFEDISKTTLQCGSPTAGRAAPEADI